MIKNDSVIDPLHEPVLPKWATTLGQTHHSATQLLMSDGPHFFRYYVLTQQERRMIPGNAQMKAGVAVGDALQDYYADTKWSLNPITKKLMPYANAKKGTEKSEIIKDVLEKYNKYQPIDPKDQEKFDKYQTEITEVITNGFLAMEELGAGNLYPITCEEQISIGQDKTDLMLPYVGRTDFALGGVREVDGVIDAPIPSSIVELKTQWSKLGKTKKNGERSFISLHAPTAPSYNHVAQCSVYSAFYDYKVPVSLVYVTKTGYKIFDCENCSMLTSSELERTFKNLNQIARRREKILSMFENQTRENLIKSCAAIIDPNWDHPYAWHGIGDEFLFRAKKLWNFT